MKWYDRFFEWLTTIAEWISETFSAKHPDKQEDES